MRKALATLRGRATAATAVVLLAALCGAALAHDSGRADMPWPSADMPAYPSSPYHGMRDGDGQVIPCRCRFQGRDFRLGELVCMSTHLGVVLTRCDLLLNNTSWVPTSTPCTTSAAPPPAPQTRVRLTAASRADPR